MFSILEHEHQQSYINALN